MKFKGRLQTIFILIVAIITAFQETKAQQFNRVESVSGLANLEKNNGVAAADYDMDGDLDIFIVAKGKDSEGNESSHSKLFRNNNNGTFEDVTNIAGLENLYDSSNIVEKFDGLNGFKHGVSWGDYDNDGFPDLFFTYSLKVQLFHNEGDGSFKEKTLESGILHKNECRNTTSTWFDVNNDGFLDLYISEWGECTYNYFYLNNGDGTFKDVSEQFGSNEMKFSYMAIPFDFNEDGWMDLYVANDFDKNDLFINQNGNGFIEQSEVYGLDAALNEMGMTVGDYNNDGHFDIFITDINQNKLYSNNGDNTFIDVAKNLDVDGTGWSWGTTFADFDLDGDEDLFVANGFKLDVPIKRSNIYFENRFIEDGKIGFVDNSISTITSEETTSVSSLAFDYDNDGDLDLIVTNADQSLFFYENSTINDNENQNVNWLKVSLEGTKSNRNGFGSKIIVKTSKSEYSRYYSGVDFLSQSILPVHFGIGIEDEINEIKIIWPSGSVDVYQDIEINSHILALEENGFQDLGIEKSLKIEGCTDPNSCNYNSNATIDDGSCIYLEAKDIIGNTTAGFLSTHKYKYESLPTSNLNWSVSGGEIINGQGTNEVSIKWDISANGVVSVIEKQLDCSSKTVNLNVDLSVSEINANHSIARIWNEALLNAIRNDYARPTVHARNLFHTSIALYDSWAVFSEEAKTYLLGNEVHGFKSNFNAFISEEELDEARQKTMCFAAFRLLNHRFKNSPHLEETTIVFNLIMDDLGYDKSFESTDYSKGSAEALGNYIAENIIEYGLTDGSNEINSYKNKFYTPINSALAPAVPGNSEMDDPNRWQPLSLNEYIDQSGNLIEGTTPEFLNPEWGSVKPFSLLKEDKISYNRDGNNYDVYYDPGSPPMLSISETTKSSESYKWGNSLVSIWGSHLNTKDQVIWDISPNSMGNISSSDFPKTHLDYSKFYNEIEGGDIGEGYGFNPKTNRPYEKQLVPRGDYARVLAEFWADGPDSETPPGHWFALLNYVNDNELLSKKIEGFGQELTNLEWDVKAYFLLGGAMHDAAITAWGIKGWYDYVRPISALRYMCDLGQSTNKSLDNYHIGGIALKQGYIEVVEKGDDLEGRDGEHVGKIKVFTWRGHDYIEDVETEIAGVGWILAENWWPYQRPSFVTPPFAGYVSGHSTYSRAAAEIMTRLTGDAYFPGGFGEFIAKKNEFLVFEDGPSVDVKLQWATYRDASDQCSLSRIWGGIHPPADDIPGRLIGELLGQNAFDFGIKYFSGKNVPEQNFKDQLVYPNPVYNGKIHVTKAKKTDTYVLFDLKGAFINLEKVSFDKSTEESTIICPSSLASGAYFLKINNESKLIYIQN